MDTTHVDSLRWSVTDQFMLDNSNLLTRTTQLFMAAARQIGRNNSTPHGSFSIRLRLTADGVCSTNSQRSSRIILFPCMEQSFQLYI